MTSPPAVHQPATHTWLPPLPPATPPSHALQIPDDEAFALESGCQLGCLFCFVLS